MKKNKFTEFLKGKGYYMLLFVGVLAIAAVALIGSNLSSNKEDQGKDYVDLNEPDNNIAAKDDNNQVAEDSNTPEDVANKGQDSNTANDTKAGQDVASNDSLLENDVFSEDEENGAEVAEVAPTAVPAVSQDKTETAKAEEEPKAVEAASKSVKPTLKFEADKGLLWPVQGNVIMNYSMDHTVYHATLMQFKCNPAIIIDAEVGTEVKAAADGIVTGIDTNEETGLTVKTDIGDNFSLLYGQLKNVKLKVGDKLDEGDVIGTIAEPTRYYTIEGSNLFFEVLENDKTVNPLLYLR